MTYLELEKELGGFYNTDGSKAERFVLNSFPEPYAIDGPGFYGIHNPDLTLVRGKNYFFRYSYHENLVTHPFLIKSEQSSSTSGTYDKGVVYSGEEVISNYVFFIVPMDAPDTLYYNCEFHIDETGILHIVD